MNNDNRYLGTGTLSILIERHGHSVQGLIRGFAAIPSVTAGRLEPESCVSERCFSTVMLVYYDRTTKFTPALFA